MLILCIMVLKFYCNKSLNESHEEQPISYCPLNVLFKMVQSFSQHAASIWSLSLSPSVNARKNESPEEKSQTSFLFVEEVRFSGTYLCMSMTYFLFSFICNAIMSYQIR